MSASLKTCHHQRTWFSLRSAIWLLILTPHLTFAAKTSEDLFSSPRIHDIAIQLEERAVASLRLNPRTPVKATVTADSITYSNVAVHLKGNYGTFQQIDGKPSLTLKFDDYQKKQLFHDFAKIHLNNSASDPTYSTEIICRELFRAANVPASRAAHARASLNGRDLGLYVMVEGVDKRFLRQFFQNPTGNLYDSEFMHDITYPLKKSQGRDPNDRSDLEALASAAADPDHATRLRRLAALVDLPEFCRFLAIEALTCHFDGYARSVNNYRIYHDPDSDKMLFLPQGMDQMFWRPSTSIFPDFSGALAIAVLETDDGRKQYRQACKELFTAVFSSLSNHIAAVHGRLSREFAVQGIDVIARLEAATLDLNGRIAERRAFLLKQLFSTEPPLVVLAPGESKTISNWGVAVDHGSPGFSITSLDSATRILWTQFDSTNPSSAVRWESRLKLPQGLYSFSARMTCNEAILRGQTIPLSVKVWGGKELQSESDRADLRQLRISHTFSISDKADETLIQCKLSASGSTVLMKLADLELTRIQ